MGAINLKDVSDLSELPFNVTDTKETLWHRKTANHQPPSQPSGVCHVFISDSLLNELLEREKEFLPHTGWLSLAAVLQ